jgi:hypothetical protein
MTYQASLSSGLVIIRGSRAGKRGKEFRGGRPPGERCGKPTPLPGADGTAKYGKSPKTEPVAFCQFRTERTRRVWASAVREKRRGMLT